LLDGTVARWLTRLPVFPFLLPGPAKQGRFLRITHPLPLRSRFRSNRLGEIGRFADLARLGCGSRERTNQITMLNWLAHEYRRGDS